jgi:hypothetical protein
MPLERRLSQGRSDSQRLPRRPKECGLTAPPIRALIRAADSARREARERIAPSLLPVPYWVLVTPLFFTLLATLPLWVLRLIWGNIAGRWAPWTPGRALGDFSLVFLALLVSAYVADSIPAVSRCAGLLAGEGCDFPGASLLFVWVFTFEVMTIPLGVPFGICALVDILRRVRRAREAR